MKQYLSLQKDQCAPIHLSLTYQQVVLPKSADNLSGPMTRTYVLQGYLSIRSARRSSAFCDDVQSEQVTAGLSAHEYFLDLFLSYCSADTRLISGEKVMLDQLIKNILF